MNKTFVWAIALVLFAGLIGFYIYSQNTRYYLQSAGKGIAYKIDRKTGKTWLIAGGREILVESSSSKINRQSPEEKAIELAKNSYALGGDLTADAQIKSWLQDQKGTLKVYGWKTRKIDEQTYLVSYTFDKGKGRIGYFFEVNLMADIVRRVSGNANLEKKYGLK